MIKKLVFVSVPMAGKTKQEVESELQKARDFYVSIVKDVKPNDIAFIDNYDFGKEDDRFEGLKNPAVAYLGRAIKRIAMCDAAIFGHGWEKARGCKIEHKVCAAYDIPMVIM